MSLSRLSYSLALSALPLICFNYGASAAVLFQDGGFEADQTLGSSTIYNTGSTFQGYTVFSNGNGNVGIVKNTFSDNTGLNNPHSGNYYLDLTGSTDSGQSQGVVQTVTGLSAGQNYTLSFYLGNRYDNTNAPVVGVSTTGTSGIFTDFTNSDYSGVVNNPIVYQLKSLTFTPLSTTASIAFRLDTVGSVVDAAIDDITLSVTPTTAVPGPIAGAGLIPLAGLGAAWFARRRKQRAAA